ncbi:Nif11-like leader peptide family natural product precursor [Microcystis wesenbergii]|uniref:Nif11-like leader peptide family natural product precursor n=1 Tax=Microcystis wesenbergii TaxID=44823 RepID=UPI0035E3DB07
MSIESVRQFSQIAQDDTWIKNSLEATTDRESLINLAVQLGSERGFSFTANEVEEYFTEERGGISITFEEVFSSFSLTRIDRTSSICSKPPYLARLICERAVNDFL